MEFHIGIKMKSDDIIHPDFLSVQKLVYEPIGLKCEKIVQEKESREYAACTFEMNNKIIKFRVAKITPRSIFLGW